MIKQLEFVPLANYHKDLPRIVEKVEIWQDCDSQCKPREWDNLGEMVFRRALDRHLSGDRMIDDEEINELIGRCRGLPPWEYEYCEEYEKLVELRIESKLQESEGSLSVEMAAKMFNIELEKLKVKYKKEPLVWLPVYAYIHSGVLLNTNNTDYPFNCKWDTSFAGIIYAENEKIIEEYGDLSIRSRGKAIACFESELKIYQQFISGDVYGFSTLDSEGDTIDSCGGFYGSDPFTNGMSEHIEFQYHGLLKQAAESIKYD